MDLHFPLLSPLPIILYVGNINSGGREKGEIEDT